MIEKILAAGSQALNPVMNRVIAVSPIRRIIRRTIPFVRMMQSWRQSAATYLAKHRRKVAIGVSLGLHGLVLAFFLIGVSSEISGGGNHGDSFGAGTGSGLTVEMVSARDVMPDALKVKQPDPAEAAQEPTDFSKPDISATATETAMLDAPSQPVVQLASEAMPDGPAGGAGEGGQSAGINDPLWKQIEPCWRRIAGKETRGVMLRIDFSPLGNIARTSDAPEAHVASDARSRAEAVQALGECGPYVAAGSREAVVIAFPAP
jgi:hypothetical protein